jgi:hypothetical protein
MEITDNKNNKEASIQCLFGLYRTEVNGRDLTDSKPNLAEKYKIFNRENSLFNYDVLQDTNGRKVQNV